MPGPIISVAELAEVIGLPDIRVVDCRWYLGEPEQGREAYEHGHLPGAVYAALDDHLSATDGPGRHPLPSPEVFASSVALLGIDRSHRVVAYDDRGGAVAARLWWMLSAQGFDRAHVLDGGIQAWEADGHPVTTTSPTPHHVVPFTPRPWSGIVTIDDVGDRSHDAVLLDARSPERYRGDEEPVDPKAGHIPGAASLPLTDLLTEDTRFLPLDQLERRLRASGVAASGQVIAQCGSGVTACHLILAAEAAGLGRPSLYVGSWSEWSSTDRPIATGAAP